MKEEQDLEKAGNPAEMWDSGCLIGTALSEHETCMRAVYGIAAEIVRSTCETSPHYHVGVGEVPAAFYTLRKNIFSTLFYSIYLVLGVSRSRRMLYGKLNHLFRIWVTSADNLLDHEDKCVLPLVMSGSSRVMREVIAIMTADRVLSRLASEAVVSGTLTAKQAETLVDESLRCLLPSAAQEASEEGGVVNRPEPKFVLETIHRYKTGLLFNIPFLGVDLIESGVDRDRADRLKDALLLFGIGCQILDDVRDIARDFVERRHNYVLSVLAHERPLVLKGWEARGIVPGDRLYMEVLPVSLGAARLGFQKLKDACATLQNEGVIVPYAPTAKMAFSMLAALDLEDLSRACAFA